MDHEGPGTDPVILSLRTKAVGVSLLDELERYWRELRGARKLPIRTEVNPAQIDAILPHSFILERVAHGVARMRVAGQSLNALLGMESRGMPLSVFFTPAARPMLAQYLEQVFAAPALVELPMVSSRGFGRSRLTGRILILPLLGNDGTVSRALGAVAVDGAAGQGGRLFEIPSEMPIRCDVLEQPLADRSGGRERPYLKLVVSN